MVDRLLRHPDVKMRRRRDHGGVGPTREGFFPRAERLGEAVPLGDGAAFLGVELADGDARPSGPEETPGVAFADRTRTDDEDPLHDRCSRYEASAASRLSKPGACGALNALM